MIARLRAPRVASLGLAVGLAADLAIAASGCGGATAEAPPATEAHAGATREAPRLVVLIVYDQLASWVLAQHLDALDPDGAVRHLAATGLHAERARYAYAGTFTAPGHVAIVTGASPWESGISSNRVWDLARHARVSVLDDGAHPILEREGGFASLDVLRVPTVADALHEASPASRIVALGMKDRSVLPPGGRHPTLALWFDVAADGFTTTRAFLPALPPWVAAFRAAHPWRDASLPWEPLRAYPELGPDDAPGEGGYGLGRTFPHDARALDEIDAFLALPSSTDYLLELARAAVREEHLGEDDVVDFLSISIASTDYAGHAFGPDSWEERDQLVRVDRAVGRFLASLEAQMPIAVVLTSDHGVAPLPEHAASHGLEGVRWTSDAELPVLRAALDRALGAREGGWVEGWVVPWITLSPAVRADEALRARAVEALRAHLTTRPGVGFVFDRREAPQLRASDDPIEHAIGLGMDEQASGDVYVLPSRGSVVDDTATLGTAHGSPFDYDREVPVLVAGPGVAHGVVHEPVEQRRVAATLAHLLGVHLERAELPPLVDVR